MTLRRWLPLLLCLLLLAGCASTESLPPPAENNPLSKAPPVKGAVTLYTYDDRSVNAQWITDSGRSAALVAALSAVNAPRTGKWTPDLVELPVYAVEFQGRDGQMIRGAWSNGCWVTEEGKAYRFDFDFDALRTDHSWQEREGGGSLAGLPCAYALTRCPNSWRGDLLPLSAELQPEDGVALTADGYADGLLRVRLRNEREEAYHYGESFGLQVLWDGVYREIPPQTPLAVDDLAYSLPAGETAEVVFDTAHYGNLPAGHYRVVLPGDISAEFQVGNSLLAEAQPKGSAATLGYYDGEVTTYWNLYDDVQEWALISALSAVPAEPAPDWTPALAAPPVYTLSLGGTEGPVRIAWSNGYWVTEEGTACHFDFDFASLPGAFDWQEDGSYPSTAYMPCGRLLALQGDAWRPDMLPTAEPLVPTEGITLTVTGYDSGLLHIRLHNALEADQCYGEAFTLQVLLNGSWRDVPVQSDRWFHSIAYPLPAGETAEVVFDTAHYGDLPAGHYRVVLSGVDIAGEFDI